MARQLARRQQRERLTGILIVCLGLGVLIVAVFALREPNGHVAASQGSDVAKKSSTHSVSSAKPSTKSSSTHAASGGSVKDVPVVVLNNTTTAGLAEQAAHRFEAGGWTVTHYGNYQNVIASTCAYYDPSAPGAKAAAQALQQQYPTIKRIAPRFAPDPGAEPLPSAPVVVVLTADYS